MRIVGIEPKAPGRHVFSQAPAPRLGLPRLLTIAKQLGHKPIIYYEEVSPINWRAVRMAHVIMISSITSTIDRAYDIIREIKRVNPWAPILIGGPHVTFLPEEALEAGADYVFRHAADESFPEWLAWYRGSADPKNEGGIYHIKGISFQRDGIYYHNQRPTVVDLNTLPTPDLSLIYGFKPPFVTICSSEGCPYDCEFCSEVPMHGRNYRFRSAERVVEDIRYYRQKYGNIRIFFGDDNLGANPSRLERLCHLLIEQGLVGNYSGQVRLDLAENLELLHLMNRAGFSRVFIGYESVNPTSLQSTGKNLDPSQMAHWTKVFHQAGLAIHAMWVLGFDPDTRETIKATIRACMRWGIETNQFLILVPIPGSRLRERLKREGRILSAPWSDYDGHHVVFQPRYISARDLQIWVMLKAMPQIYNFWQTLHIFVRGNWRTIRRSLSLKTPHPWAEFRENFVTAGLRLWGQKAIRGIKSDMRNYLSRLGS